MAVHVAAYANKQRPRWWVPNYRTNAPMRLRSSVQTRTNNSQSSESLCGARHLPQSHSPHTPRRLCPGPLNTLATKCPCSNITRHPVLSLSPLPCITPACLTSLRPRRHLCPLSARLTSHRLAGTAARPAPFPRRSTQSPWSGPSVNRILNQHGLYWSRHGRPRRRHTPAPDAREEARQVQQSVAYVIS